MKIFAYLAAIILCGFSLFCSVALWYSEQPNFMMGFIFGGFAAGLEICKFIFFPLAARTSGPSKFGLNVFGSVLVCFSVFATVSFLETGANITNGDARNSSFEYQAKLTTIKNIESKLKITMDAKASAVKNNYRKEAKTYDIRLDKLEADKQKELILLKEIKVISPNGTHSILVTLASLFNIELVTVRQIAYLIIAVLVDLGGIQSLMIITQKETTKDPHDKKPQTRKNKGLNPVLDPVLEPVSDPVSTLVPDPVPEPVSGLVPDPLRKAIILVASGKLGENPSINKVAKKCGVGKPKAKIIIDRANELIADSRKDNVTLIKD